MNSFISLFKRKPLPEYKILANKVLQSLEAVTYAFGLSKKDVKKMWKIFDSLDRNHTGLIDASFVGAMINASSLPYVRRMLLFYNWDHTGMMSFHSSLSLSYLLSTVAPGFSCLLTVLILHLTHYPVLQEEWIFLNIY